MQYVQHGAAYLVAHWGAIIGVLTCLIGIFGTVKNALTYFGTGPKVTKAEGLLGKLADVLSIVVKQGHDSPMQLLPGPLGQLLGWLSMPGFVSRPRAGLPLPDKGAQQIKVGAFLPFLLIGTLLVSGCAGAGVFGQCLKPVAPELAQSVVSEVIMIASKPAGYIAALVQLGEQVGPQVVDCIAQAIAADEKQPPAVKAHATEYVAHRKAMGVKFACR